MTGIFRLHFQDVFCQRKISKIGLSNYDNLERKFNLDEFNEKFMNVTFNWRNSRPEYVFLEWI